MRELGGQKKSEFCDGFVGRRAQILIEAKVDRTTGLHRGFSRNYLPVAVTAAGDLANREIDVHLDGFRNGWLTGKVSNAIADFSACVDFFAADLQ